MQIKRRYRDSPADLVFAPTLACTGFSEDLLLSYAMITCAILSQAYVDPFAHSWPGFSTTDPESRDSVFNFSIFTYLAANASIVTFPINPASLNARVHSLAVLPVVKKSSTSSTFFSLMSAYFASHFLSTLGFTSILP